jgi:hypothetical protein
MIFRANLSGHPIDATHAWRPGQGAATFLHALIRHRRVREKSILSRLNVGDTTVPALVANIYKGLDPALTTAAALSVLAHLEDLVERGLVTTEGAGVPGSIFRPALNVRHVAE